MAAMNLGQVLFNIAFGVMNIVTHPEIWSFAVSVIVYPTVCTSPKACDFVANRCRI